MSEWDIARRTGRCQVSGKAIGEGDDYYAVLFDRGESFERLDVAVDNWTGPPEGAFSYWRARVPVKAKKKRLLVDDAVLVGFFERLGQESEPSKLEFRFVLALILMRKRLLRYERTVNDGGQEVWLMKLKGSEAAHRVVNPNLGEDRITAVSSQLSAILHEDVAEMMDVNDENGDES